MRRYSKCVGVGLAGIAGAFAIQSHAATAARPTIEQSKILDFLERGAQHALKLGDHVPVTALVMRPDGQLMLIDREQGFARQDDALVATFMHLIPMAMAKQIKASGIMLQPGDAGKEKLPVLLFDLEQVGHPRFLVMLTYQRDGDVVTFGPKTYKVAPAQLLAD